MASFPVTHFEFGLKNKSLQNRTIECHFIPPPAGSVWISIKEVTDHVESSSAWVTAARSGSTWFQFCSPTAISVDSWRITPTFPAMTSWGGWHCGWLGTEKEESYHKHRAYAPREKGVPLSASFKNSINNNSKCNNAQTPGTQVSLGGLVTSVLSGTKERSPPFASLLGPH